MVQWKMTRKIDLQKYRYVYSTFSTVQFMTTKKKISFLIYITYFGSHIDVILDNIVVIDKQKLLKISMIMVLFARMEFCIF